ncbi:MAG: DUF58 domain-containing protein [Butyrivibrio sp.]|nr:DUF58 domain-containing protein [Butyrivibrio sp.]
MNIDYEYLSKIRRAVALYTNKKTSNILDGDFHSIHKGRSMEFEDLKEYALGDEVHDIDWKSSSRMGKTLVRRYMTDRRHNVMFVCDCGKKMTGDTPRGESKKEVALLTFGTVAYLTDKNGADFSMAFPKGDTSEISMFKAGTEHIERLIYEYEKYVDKDSNISFEQCIKNVLNCVHKRMIVILITDIEGLNSVSESTLKAVACNNDLMAMCVEDAMLTGDNVFDNELGHYEKWFLSHSDKLRKQELEYREAAANSIASSSKQSRTSVISLSGTDEIIDKTIVLFERHRHGNYGYIKTTI